MKSHDNLVSILLLTFSFTGLILVAAFANHSPQMRDPFYLRKPLVGVIFSFVCILGILAGMFPAKCSSAFHFGDSKGAHEGFTESSAGFQRKPLAFHGHHPNCGNFDAHLIRSGNKILCAGCIGLVAGALLSLIAVASYFFINVNLWSNHFPVFWIGFAGVSCGLLQYHLFNLNKGAVHLSLNVFFVFGVSLLLIAVDSLTQNVILDFYIITLSIFWLYVRIMLSQLNHKKACLACPLEGCSLHKKGWES